MKNKVLVLVNEEFNGYFPTQDHFFFINTIYNTQDIIHRILRKLILKTNVTFVEKILFQHWIALLDKIDTIILFDTGNAIEILNFLSKIFHKRIILWYWNPVSWTKFPITKIDRKRIEIWSYNMGDCKKYDLKYNTQFYLEKNMPIDLNQDTEYDVLFIGTDKNRYHLLKKIDSILSAQNISKLFYLVKSSGNTNESKDIHYQKPVSYRELLDMLTKSKAVIDLVPEGQNCLTLRPLEALYYQKKLITNMKFIVDYDLYNPNNIFILGVDDISNLSSFIRSPYDKTLHSQLCEKYSEKQWLENFFKGE